MWIRLQQNVPRRTDWYLMQVASMLSAKQVELAKFKLKFDIGLDAPVMSDKDRREIASMAAYLQWGDRLRG